MLEVVLLVLSGSVPDTGIAGVLRSRRLVRDGGLERHLLGNIVEVRRGGWGGEFSPDLLEIGFGFLLDPRRVFALYAANLDGHFPDQVDEEGANGDGNEPEPGIDKGRESSADSGQHNSHQQEEPEQGEDDHEGQALHRDPHEDLENPRHQQRQCVGDGEILDPVWCVLAKEPEARHEVIL